MNQAVTTREQVFTIIRDIVVDIKAPKPHNLPHIQAYTDKIGEHTDLLNDLNCDSLDLIDVTMQCEEAFDIEITDDEKDESLRTMRGATDLACRKLNIDFAHNAELFKTC